MFYKIALHQKYAFLQITKAPLTHCIYIYFISLSVGEGGLAEYSVLNPCFVVVFQRRRPVRVRVTPAPNLPVAFGPL